MADPLHHLEVGQSFTIGGSNINGLVVGPLPRPARLEIYAWHSGYKTGEGNSAYLSVTQDGNEIGRSQDAIFDNYSLAVAKTVLLAEDAQTSVSIAYGNVMATVRDFGLKIIVVRTG